MNMQYESVCFLDAGYEILHARHMVKMPHGAWRFEDDELSRNGWGHWTKYPKPEIMPGTTFINPGILNVQAMDEGDGGKFRWSFSRNWGFRILDGYDDLGWAWSRFCSEHIPYDRYYELCRKARKEIGDNMPYSVHYHGCHEERGSFGEIIVVPGDAKPFGMSKSAAKTIRALHELNHTASAIHEAHNRTVRRARK